MPRSHKHRQHVPEESTGESNALVVHPSSGCKKRFIDLYDSTLTTVYINVAVSGLTHVPSHDQRDKDQHPPYVMCPHFTTSFPSTCPMGDTCKFVHATPEELQGSRSQVIHVNFVCACLEDSRYERLPHGDILTVFSPNGRPPSEEIESERILVTYGSTSNGPSADDSGGAPRIFSHCAHFHFNKVCNRGACCLFVHAIDLQPDAVPSLKKIEPVSASSYLEVPGLEYLTARKEHSKLVRTGAFGVVPQIEVSDSGAWDSEGVGGTDVAEPSSRTVEAIERRSSFTSTRSPLLLAHNSSGHYDSNDEGGYYGADQTGYHSDTSSLNARSPYDEAMHPHDSFHLRVQTRSPMRTLSVGSRTLLFADHPKDKDVQHAGGSDSSSTSATTTPIMFRHNPYGVRIHSGNTSPFQQHEGK